MESIVKIKSAEKKNKVEEFNFYKIMQKNLISTKYIKSESGKPFSEQIGSFLTHIEDISIDWFPIKLTIFINCDAKSDYDRKYSLIQSEKNKRKINSPIALICQPPAGGEEMILEVVLVRIPDKKIIHKNEQDWILLKNSNFEVLLASSLAYKNKSFEENVKESFEKLNRIFKETGFTYSDVLRQWNYIEKILEQTNENNHIKQRYQVFNNYRSINYQSSDFFNGYPVATGIGASQGSVCVEVVAIKGINVKMVPIHNSRQVDAHCYSDHVLVGAPVEKLTKNTSPKFERAKLFETSELGMLLVSGTASIIGEETVCIGDVQGQTLTTIENIDLLLEQAQKLKQSEIELMNYRVYIKNPHDYEKVKGICEQRYKSGTGVFLISDICRDNLLVEIECNYIIK